LLFRWGQPNCSFWEWRRPVLIIWYATHR
jgi:hypothetical protein